MTMPSRRSVVRAGGVLVGLCLLVGGMVTVAHAVSPHQRVVLLSGSRAPLPLPYEQIVGTNARIPETLVTSGVGTTRLESRRLSVLGGQNVGYIRLVYANYIGPTNGGETATGNAYTLETSLEIPTAPNTSCVAVTFSGASPATVPDGSGAFVSDKIYPSSFGLTTFAAGTQIFIHDSVLVTSGQKYPDVTSYTVSTGEKAVQNDNASSQVMTPGVPTGTAVAVQTPLIGVVGAFMLPEVSLIFLGDSHASYQNDSRGSGLNGTNGGMYVRAANGVNGRQIPWANLAVSGVIAQGMSTTLVKRLLMVKYATHVIVDINWNDLNNGRTAVQIQGYDRLIWAALNAVVPRVYQAFALPGDTSSDSFATTVNQTPRAAFGVGGVRDVVNVNIAADVGSNGLTGTIDLNSGILQDATVTSAWRANAVANAFTADGIHAQASAGLPAAATTVRTFYGTLSPARSGF